MSILHERIRMGGQTLPLFALMWPALLALVGLGIDGARIYVERREAQSAADLAAVSGAVALVEGNASLAVVRAELTSVANGYSLGQTSTKTPYLGRTDWIEVEVETSVDTLFLPVLGMISGHDFSTVDVSARAVAQAGLVGGSGGGFAIFALEGCPSEQKTIDIGGSDSFFIGKVHSNSDVYLSGSNTAIDGATTSVCGNGYPSFEDGGAGNTLDPAPTTASAVPDPIDLDTSDFTCDFLAPSTGDWDLSSDGVWWVGGTKDSKTLRAGTYCARGSDGFIKLGDSEIVIEDVESGPGGVTMVAPCCIDISGSDFDLHPHEHGVLLAAYGDSDTALKMAGSGGSWQGSMYAPSGTAEISGQDDVNIAGSIVGERVKLNGSDATVNGQSGEGGAGPQQLALVE